MSEYPSGWRTVHLRDAGRWLSGGTPNTSLPHYWDGDIPWISAASLKEFNIADSDRRVSRLGAASGTRTVPRDTVLFVVRGMSLKTEFRIGVTRREVTFGQDCKAILAVPEIDPRFLAYSLKAHAGRVLAMVDEAGHGTGRLPSDQLGALTIGVPRLGEQRRIAEILDSADESIRFTERLIGKLHATHHAIKDDLFRGLLRDAEVGKTWRIRPTTCGEGFKLSSGKPLVRTAAETTRERMIPVYGGNGKVGYCSDALTPAKTVIIGRVGENCGATHFTDEPAWVTDNALWIRWLHPALDSEFVFRYLEWFDLRRTQSRTGQPLVTQSRIAAVPIVTPDLEQQKRVTAIIRSSHQGIAKARQELEKLKKLKHGLMDDLLTGHVRVKVGEA